jgi:hypothetical protein
MRMRTPSLSTANLSLPGSKLGGILPVTLIRRTRSGLLLDDGPSGNYLNFHRGSDRFVEVTNGRERPVMYHYRHPGRTLGVPKAPLCPRGKAVRNLTPMGSIPTRRRFWARRDATVTISDVTARSRHRQAGPTAISYPDAGRRQTSQVDGRPVLIRLGRTEKPRMEGRKRPDAPSSRHNPRPTKARGCRLEQDDKRYSRQIENFV